MAAARKDTLRRRAAERSRKRRGRPIRLVEYRAPCGHHWRHDRDDEPGTCPWCDRPAPPAA